MVIFEFIYRFFDFLTIYDNYLHLCKEQYIDEASEYKGRFDFAWKNALIWARNRECFSVKCSGDCYHCNCKNR